MKTKLLLLALISLPAFNLVGQSSQPPPLVRPGSDLQRPPPGLSAEQLESMVIYESSLANRVIGVLPQIRRADNPLHLINPLAPASYGNGYDNVVYDPHTGRAEGIILLGIKF
jgi:hypothetical protein